MKRLALGFPENRLRAVFILEPGEDVHRVFPPPEDLAEFRRWFTEFDSARWDREIEQDVTAGRLDAFLAEAQADYLSGDATRAL